MATDLRLPTDRIVMPDKDRFLNEENPFEAMMSRFDRAAQLLDLEPGLYKVQTPGPSGPLTAVAHVGVEDVREMSEVTATDEKLQALIDATGGGVFWTKGSGVFASSDPTSVDVPRVTMMSSAKVLAGSGWLGLKDREAYVTRGVKLTPMFTGLLALAALLFLIALAWWREGR